MADKIELEPITSSNLQAIGYDPRKRILAIQFKNSEIFHYAEVPLDLVAEFYASASRGSFYGWKIRGKFTGQKMTGHCPDCGDLGWVDDRCEDCGCSPYRADPYKPKTKAAATSV